MFLLHGLLLLVLSVGVVQGSGSPIASWAGQNMTILERQNSQVLVFSKTTPNEQEVGSGLNNLNDDIYQTKGKLDILLPIAVSQGITNNKPISSFLIQKTTSRWILPPQTTFYAYTRDGEYLYLFDKKNCEQVNSGQVIAHRNDLIAAIVTDRVVEGLVADQWRAALESSTDAGDVLTKIIENNENVSSPFQSCAVVLFKNKDTRLSVPFLKILGPLAVFLGMGYLCFLWKTR